MDTTYLKSFKVEIQNCFFIWTFRIIFYVGQFFCLFQLTQFVLGWFVFFIAVVNPISHSESWPFVFSVRWVCWVLSPTGKWQHPSFSPLRNSAETFTPLTQGRGWRVCGTLMCPEAALWLFWSRDVQLQGMFGFPASCGFLLRYCIDCNIMLHVRDEQ